MEDAPNDERCVQFSDYILSTYNAPDATFPPTIWANHDLDEVKTTNGCESFHRHFSDLFRSPHPNVFELMANLKDIQAYSATKRNTIRTAWSWGSGFASTSPFEAWCDCNNQETIFCKWHFEKTVCNKNVLEESPRKTLNVMLVNELKTCILF